VTLYYLGNHRSPDQLAEMRRLEGEGTCIFCPPAVEEPGASVLRRLDHWVIRPNAYPYRGTRLHLLLVPRAHVTDLLDLDGDALHEFWDAVRWVRDTYRLDFYGLGARCGDCAYTGGTIVHAHVHFIVGDVEAREHTPVRLKLSSKPAEPPAPRSS
jgi:ATP adenylyltransferase